MQSKKITKGSEGISSHNTSSFPKNPSGTGWRERGGEKNLPNAKLMRPKKRVRVGERS